MSSPPIPRDVQDFQFKLVSRFKVFNKTERPFTGPVNALAVSSKHGLIFVASPSEIQVFETSSLLENPINKGSGADVEIFPRHCIQLPSQPSHIGISCDQVHVAVALAPKDAQSCPTALIYPITSFTLKNPSPAWELRLSASPGVHVRDLVWNPGLPPLMCFCLSNGSVSVYELKGTSHTFQIFTLPETTSALSVSWSPKGKQLVIGAANGTLAQYKPDLKQVKTIPAPPPNPGISSDGNISPVSLLWLSSFQFAVVYGNPSDNGSGTNRPGLHIVNAPKGGSVTYLNYDDICYSSGELRPIQYYLAHQQRWNVLLMSSANSTEVGVLAADGSGGEPLVWEQWALEDASRAELPLSHSREEMYAIGMAIDTSPTAPIPWGENQSIPPAPLLLVLSHHGLLCAFNILNLRPGAPHDLCSPPELVPGIRENLVNSGPPSSSSALPAAASRNTPAFGALPIIACEAPGFPMTSKPSFSFAPSPQTPSSLFSSTPANQSFSSLAAASGTPLFGAQVQKADSEKGWLSGQGGNTFSGFGSLGSAGAQPKDGVSSASAGASSFSFAQSPAPIGFPGASVTAVTAFSNQSQATPNFSYGEQSQTLSVPPVQAPATQPAALPIQSFPTLGSSLMPKAPPADKDKMGGNQLGMSSTGKMKFGSTAEVSEGDGSNNSSGGLSVGSSQLWATTTPGLAVPKQAAVAPKTEVQSAAPPSSVVQSQPQVTANVAPVVSDAAIFHAIVKETELFQKELKLLKERHQKLNIEIGSPAEKNNLVQRVNSMSQFLCELNETTQGQASEIAALKTLLVEAFAWVEEAKSRQIYSKNSRYMHLAMNQDLDPVIKKHLLAIRNRIHYLDTQLQQVDNNLDNQWSQFQNSYNKRMRKNQNWYRSDSSDILLRKEIHMPSMEYVYQTILSQQQVLEQHKARLDELEAKLKDRAKWELGTSLYAVSSTLTSRKTRTSPNSKKSLANDQDLSSMAESLLAIQLSVSRVEGGLSAQLGSKNPLVPKKISSRQRSQLCRLLAHRPMTRVLPSPRSISSSAVLPIPSSLNVSISPIKAQDKSPIASVSLPLDGQAKSTPPPTKKEMLPTKSTFPPSGSLPVTSTTTSAAIVTSSILPMTSKVSGPPSASTLGMSSVSMLSSVTSQSFPVVNYTVPSSSKPAPTGFAAPGMGTLASSSVAPSKASTAPAFGLFLKGNDTLSAAPISSTVITSSLSVATPSPSTTAVQSSAVPVTTTSTPVFSLPTSTKTTPLQSSNISIFGGVPPSNIATTSSEGSSWSFSTPGSFSFGSSAKPGVSITGNPVTPTAVSTSPPLVATTISLPSPTPPFSLNFYPVTKQTTKPSFPLNTKPVTTQPSFTLPSSTFGSQNTSASLGKEPLFVFGGNIMGAGNKAAPADGDSAPENQEETQKEEKKAEEEPNSKEEKGTSEVVPENTEKIKQDTTEKPASTFSFASAFGNSPVLFGKSSTAITSTLSTPVTATPAVAVARPEYEDITPENKIEEVAANTGKTEEKSPPARSLFSEFNFKLSGNKTEMFGEKTSIFSSSSSPAVTSSPIAPSIFGTPTPVTTSLQSSVTTTPTNVAVPIISPAEPSTTTPNPLSSLGNIVASLGGNNFNKSTPEVSKPSNTFSSFSFSLSSKDNGVKPLIPDTTAAATDESQKTPIKAFPTTSTAEPSTPAIPVAESLPTGTTDFGQGLANILGQSLPSSPAQAQQQPAANPFASAGSMFGSSSASSSTSTVSLFGKPSEGTSSVGMFGQPLTQEGTTSSFFGGSSSTTPATTSGSTFESGSLFGQAASSPSSIFGGSEFGSSKPFGQTTGTGFSLGSSVFGQSVGAPSSSSSIFGSPPASTSGASPFQTPATASSSVFGSGSSGENRLFASVAQTGFGSPSSSFQAKPGGFGGSPVFGAMAPGSTSPSFGGAPTFGSPPAFGSHVFGSASAAPLFGSALPAQGTAPASTFENLATAQTLTFGNLAQSSNTGGPFGAVAGPSASQPPPAFGGGGGSSTGGGSSSFGGSSFTSWR